MDRRINTQMKNSVFRKTVEMIVSIIICQSAGIIGSVFTVKSITTWYDTLNKPVFNPPNWLFGPVWLMLYTMMGISLYLIWQKRKTNGAVRFSLWIFAVHLALNAMWTLIFFGAKLLLPAFMEIVLLWIMIIITIYLFGRISKPAGLLLVPYLLWVSFASILNFSIWLLNK